MVDKQTEALRLAIDWIENAPFESDSWSAATKDTTLQACKEALEQEEALDEMVRLAQEMGAYDAEQPAQGIELEWYQKGWDDAKQEGISKTETTTATIKESLKVEPAQEPVAVIENYNDTPTSTTKSFTIRKRVRLLDHVENLPLGNLYTHPAPSQWISVKDRFPEYLEGKDYSANVLGICKLSETHSYMGIFSLIIVDYTEDGHLWAWAKLDRCYGDLHEGECEFDDDYEITHWMPLPDAPKE